MNEKNIICGRNPVLEALKSEANIDTVYINGEGGILGRIRSMAKKNGAVVKDVNFQKLEQLTQGAAHQGVAAVTACAEYVSVEDILEISAKKGTEPFIIICDEIEDPHIWALLSEQPKLPVQTELLFLKDEVLHLTLPFIKPLPELQAGFQWQGFLILPEQLISLRKTACGSMVLTLPVKIMTVLT